MFECKSCATLQDEVKHLRETNQKLTDQLVAIASPYAYHAINQAPYDPKDYYGSDFDEMIEYDDYGQKIIVRKDPVTKS